MMNDEWIKDLKVGDKVYVRGGSFGGEQHTLTKVIKITPAGKIKIEGGNLFKDGLHKCDSWHWDVLEQYTSELEAKLKTEAHYNHMCYSINAQDMRGMPLNQVQRIYDILREKTT